jgi:hypothetical protein
MLTTEIINKVYENFLTLNQGFSLGNNGAWLLLLNKVMGLVADVKIADLTRDDRIELVVAVVIRYLDEKTDIADEQLQHITTSVRAMCLAMLGYGGELAGKQPIVRVPNDPELVSTPLRITQLLMDKMRELIRREPHATENLGAFLPQIVMLCITTVNKFSNLTNLEKRNLIVGVIISFLDEYIAPRLTKPAQQMSLGLFKADLGNMIDLFVGIAKGKSEYNFNYRDPQGRRNLFSCLGAGIVRAVAVLGLCFTRHQPTNVPPTVQITTSSVPTNTTITTTVEHTENKVVETQLLRMDTVLNNDLHTIQEETVSTHDEIDDLPQSAIFTEPTNTKKKDETLDADASLPPIPLYRSYISEIEPAPPIPDCSDPVALVHVIIDTHNTGSQEQYLNAAAATVATAATNNEGGQEYTYYQVNLDTTSDV